MRLFAEKVFDAFVTGRDTVYTDAMWNDLLGSADALELQATADQVAGSNPTWSIRSEHSNDGRNWFPTGFLPEAYGAIVSPSVGGNDPSNHLGAFVRYSIALDADVGSTPQAYIRLIVCGRGDQPVELHVPHHPGP